MRSQVNSPPTELPEQPVSLAAHAYEAIRDMLVTLEIQPGAAISEESLGARLGFGRTPIREAIKRLEADGLIAIYPRRGTFATDVNITDLALITEIRLALEPSAAYDAALRATAAERDELRALRDQCTNLDHADEALMRLDRSIHHAIYRAAHNGYLERNLTQYYSLVHRIWHLFLGRLPDVSEHIAEHASLLDAIVEGRAEEARTMVHDHVASFEQTIRQIL